MATFPWAKRLICSAGLVVALLGVAASASHYFTEDYNTGMDNYPVTVATHVVLGGLYLLIAPFQFLSALRRQRPDVHRRLGRWAIGFGLLAGGAAIVMSLAIPFSGDAERLLVTPFAAWFVYCLGLSLDHARARRIAEHREWMIRAFALASSIATMRLVFVPALVIAGEPGYSQIQFLSLSSFMVAFAIHLGVSEWWIRRTRDTPQRDNRSIMDPATG